MFYKKKNCWKFQNKHYGRYSEGIDVLIFEKFNLLVKKN